MVTVKELLKGKVTLEVESLDRIYLNGYVPTLQVGGQVVSFMTGHLGYAIPSAAIFEQIGTRFRGAVRRFAEARGIPLISFSKGERKIDRMLPLLRAAEKAGSYGVVAIGVAQEFQNVFSANQRKTPTGAPWFSFYKADRRVTCYYFYIFDAEFGPCFLKVCAYFPYPVKLWCNGHEWAKRQAAKQGIAFTPLSNGFASCDDPGSAGQGCAIGPALFERIQQPYVREGQRTGALRFGDPRAIALAGALCLSLHAVAGFTNRSLRALVAGLLGTPYGVTRMTYDLRRLRLHGLIQRINGHRYGLTPDGQRFALFYAKLANRVFPPLFAAPQPNSPPKLQRALDAINQCVDEALRAAGLRPAA